MTQALSAGHSFLGQMCARVVLASIFIVMLTAPPAVAQAITVFGDSEGAACYRAASSELPSRSGLESCTDAIESGGMLRRDLAATYLNRGIIYAARGDVNAALADYLEAREIRPNLPESYVGEGNVRFLAGDFNAALDSYAAALEHGLKARHAAYFNRGLTFEQMGRWDEAEAEYSQAAALAPEWAAPQNHIERVRARRAAAESVPTN
jgi:tetratricopeptide (TPR) repeat protein